MDECARLLASELVQPLLSVMFPAEPSADAEALLAQTGYTQPALFAIEVALARLWQSWGVQPDLVLGHSVGEVAAACVAGVFSLADGLKLIAARGRLMQALPADGAMVACMTDEVSIQQRVADYPDQVSIAAVNGPRSVVISGATLAVETIVAQLNQAGIKTKPLKVSHAFHSPLMEPMLAEFAQIAQTITYHPPTCPLISNLTGHVADDTISTPAYWVQHVRAAVRFADSIQTVFAQAVDVLLEIGPQPTLLGLAKLQLPASAEPLCLPSLRAKRDDGQQMLSSLGQLYTRGVEIDWVGFDQDYARQRVALPTYAWQRQRYWLEPVEPDPSLHAMCPLVDRCMPLPQYNETVFEKQ